MKLSVIITCYNDGEFLADSIGSVQGIPPGQHDLIIVNDGSTDPETLAILDVYKQQGLRIIDQPNEGISSARNTGVAASSSEYFIPLDADNKIRAGYIQQGIKHLDANPQTGVVYANGYLFGNREGPWNRPEFNTTDLILKNFIDACAVIRRSAWEDCGGYDNHMAGDMGWEDWELWLHIASKGWHFHHLKEPLFDYRIRDGSLLHKHSSKEENKNLGIAYLYGKHWPFIQKEMIHLKNEAKYSLSPWARKVRGVLRSLRTPLE